ncbi:hypothetical protein KPA97_23660, partial [Burkholderia cenocepacia]|nr:hypothetical protein [Burkholderia cenocepacia]
MAAEAIQRPAFAVERIRIVRRLREMRVDHREPALDRDARIGEPIADVVQAVVGNPVQVEHGGHAARVAFGDRERQQLRDDLPPQAIADPLAVGDQGAEVL